MSQTQSDGPVRTAYISVLLTVNNVSHNPAKRIYALHVQSLSLVSLQTFPGMYLVAKTRPRIDSPCESEQTIMSMEILVAVWRSW